MERRYQENNKKNRGEKLKKKYKQKINDKSQAVLGHLNIEQHESNN